MNRLLLGVLLAGCASPALADVAKPAALTADGVPPVPDALAAASRPYMESRGAGFAGWNDADRSMLISTRFANVSQLHSVASQGYCFQVDLTWRSIEAGFAVAEVPITFVEREQGKSKMTGEIVREALVRVTKWGLRRRGNQLLSSVRALLR